MRIGHKLALQAGCGVALLAALMGVQQWSFSTIGGLGDLQSRTSTVIETVVMLGAEVSTVQALNRGIQLSKNSEELAKAMDAVPATASAANAAVDRALARAGIPENRARLNKAKEILADYLAAVAEIGAVHTERLALRREQMELAAAWDKRMGALVETGLPATLPGRLEIERDLVDLDAHLKSSRTAMWRFEATGDKGLLGAINTQLSGAATALTDVRGRLADAALLREVDELHGTLGRLQDVMTRQVHATEREMAVVTQKSTPLREKLTALIDETRVTARERNDAASRELEASIRNATMSGLLLGALALLVMVGTAVSTTLSVARPIRRIADILSQLASGRRDVEVPYANRADEVGDAAKAAEAFRVSLVRTDELEAEERAQAEQRAAQAAEMAAVVREVGVVVEAAAQGDFGLRAEVRTSQPELGKLVESVNQINQIVDAATGDFAEVLGAVAQGDLTQTVRAPYSGRLEELKTAINTTVVRLAETVTVIQATTVDVNNAAGEINVGADDLSRRTEGQAASLEETAATTEQLAASVKASASASRRAVGLAEEAMSVAEQGGGVVREAVEAMSRIEAASQRISAITSVIDDIAFQTNLLALNAAVEAARAGEAGKGFAVVASEVRTLAQRSSEAAKDITGLISSSAAEVAQGVRLVRSAGDTLEQIVSASVKVSETVGEISSAAAEQANGIEEMSQTIAHMDEMTQQNAALAEQSAASATSLTGQIRKLDELVAAFKTDARMKQAVRPDAPQRLQDLAKSAFSGPRPTSGEPRRRVAVGGGRTVQAGDWSQF
ncbi:methyl-accepting chemotaxis protein [Alsobacter sp. SYSU M60028]|uniref:Methyl-accepting chemotaxis protein n=1 Tax=Alsobacter ponti TaxID=2962936 RepID=A0ABT1LCW7_9HYPH|nr:methyl-accepting chemotaxis protein [Alsobacter ponti]MCP8939279.1 methyl-accepting chemotaxis protein [Alsobacter ponti]